MAHSSPSTHSMASMEAIAFLGQSNVFIAVLVSILA